MTEDTYSELSYKLTKSIDQKIKKNSGIYFTPPKTINESLKELNPYIKNIKYVLEPSCGSCEYISLLDKKYKNLNITGIELNKKIYQSVKKLEKNNIKIYNKDYLLFENNIKYDLIIGNPPYFVMKKKDVNPLYHNYFDGRPNIFILFIIKSLKLLNTNGILSFVLPKNFLNCLYYDKTRDYIFKNFKILNIIECNDNYIETKQNTIVIIIQNNLDNIKISNNKFILINNKYTILGIPETISKLKELYINSSTLSQLKCNVNVGTLVWNQCKDKLTDNINKTRLIYSSDIKNNTLSLSQFPKFIKKKKIDNSTGSNNIKLISNPKKNFIKKSGSKEPILVINRGYGVGNYQFNYCLVKGDFEYLIENHLICIKHLDNMTNEELIEFYKTIIKSFENEKTKKFIDLYFGNNAINTTELYEILPIYDI